MAAEQKKIERELVAFEKTIYGDPARRDSLDSISAAKDAEKAPRKVGRSRRTSPSTNGVVALVVHLQVEVQESLQRV